MDTRDNVGECKGKKSAFTIMTNVRNNCKQPVSRKFLMLTLATYCDGEGMCWPSNKTLATDTGISKRTIQRLLPALVAEGELEILTPGKGRDQKRVIRLTKYVETKGVTAMTCLNAPASLGKAGWNSQGEQPTKQNTLKGRYTHGAQTPAKKEEVFYSSQKNGKNGFPNGSEVLRPKKRGAKIPNAQRNRIINKLNVKKQAIYRDTSYTYEERERALDKVNHALQKL